MPALSSDSLSHRRIMVDGQIRTFGITDLDLIDRFLDVPREMFVDPGQESLAWSDAPLVLKGAKPRALLRPMVLAKMFQAAAIQKKDRVLEIAGGNGYGAAILSGLAASVVTLETEAARTDATLVGCKALGLLNVTSITGDLSQGVPAHGPYDVIILNGAIETSPATLLQQLADRGRLIAICSTPGRASGEVTCFERQGRHVGERILFESSSAVLEGFEAVPVFSF